jgi:hypothetical protein
MNDFTFLAFGQQDRILVVRDFEFYFKKPGYPYP